MSETRNTQPTPISDRIVNQFRKGEATSDGLILTMVELELKLAAICRERDEARAESIRWMSIAEGRGRTDDEEENDTQAELAAWELLKEAEKELATVTAQRDRLAEALHKVSRSWNYVEVAQQALQSLTPKEV
jgi:transposase-like protein